MGKCLLCYVSKKRSQGRLELYNFIDKIINKENIKKKHKKTLPTHDDPVLLANNSTSIFTEYCNNISFHLQYRFLFLSQEIN